LHEGTINTFEVRSEISWRLYINKVMDFYDIIFRHITTIRVWPLSASSDKNLVIWVHSKELVPASGQGVKRPGREVDHSPPNIAEVKKMWIYTSTPHTPSWHSA
jgi:hypothetical protein